MAILRKVKKNDFTIIDNNVFKNKKLTLKGKGLLCTMLSLPDDWNFSEDGLTKLSNDTKYSIRNTIQELMDLGYLTRERKRDNIGRLNDAIYTIYEEPTFENQKQADTPICETPKLVNQKTYKILINNKVLKENNNNKLLLQKKFEKPTLEEVKLYCEERNNNVDPERFINFYESKGWMIGKNKMKDWKACIRTWEQNNKKKEAKLPSWFNQNLDIQKDDDKELEKILNEIGE